MALRLAVVGIGKVAMKNYLPHLSAQPEVELAYLSRSSSAVQSAIDKFGGHALGGFDKLSAWADVVFVLTSEQAHHSVAFDLIARGVSQIFIEKPLVAQKGQAAVTENDFFLAKELLRDAERNGVTLAINFNYRYFEHVARARRVIAERMFGRPLSVTARSHYACWSHCIDLIQTFVGPVAEITAIASRGRRTGSEIVAQDSAVAFRTVGDASGTLLGTAGLAWQHPLFELTIAFEGGRIDLADLDGALTVYDSASDRTEITCLSKDVSRWDRYNASFIAAIDAYLTSVRACSPPPVPAIAGLEVLQFEASVQRSVKERRTVSVAEDFAI